MSNHPHPKEIIATTIQDLISYLQQIISENPERKNEHIICKYDGKISKVQFRSPTFDEMTTFDLDYHNDEKYLFMS